MMISLDGDPPAGGLDKLLNYSHRQSYTVLYETTRNNTTLCETAQTFVNSVDILPPGAYYKSDKWDYLLAQHIKQAPGSKPPTYMGKAESWGLILFEVILCEQLF